MIIQIQHYTSNLYKRLQNILFKTNSMTRYIYKNTIMPLFSIVCYCFCFIWLNVYKLYMLMDIYFSPADNTFLKIMNRRSSNNTNNKRVDSKMDHRRRTNNLLYPCKQNVCAKQYMSLCKC